MMRSSVGGLEVADRGTVVLHGEDITEKSARERNVGFVFQHYALFRHMTVAENIGYGLKVRNVPAARAASSTLSLPMRTTLLPAYPLASPMPFTMKTPSLKM